MPEHPLAAVYVWGALVSLMVVAGLTRLRPWQLGMLADDAKVPAPVFAAILVIAYGPFWPLAWMVALAELFMGGGRRG